MCIGITKDAFQSLKYYSEKLRHTSLETKKNCYGIKILLYGSKCYTIHRQMKRRLEATEMWLYVRIRRILWAGHMNNEKVFIKIGMKRTRKIEKNKFKFLGRIMGKEELENLKLPDHTEGQRNGWKLTYLATLCKWMAEPEMITIVKKQILLRSINDKKL